MRPVTTTCAISYILHVDNLPRACNTGCVHAGHLCSPHITPDFTLAIVFILSSYTLTLPPALTGLYA